MSSFSPSENEQQRALPAHASPDGEKPKGGPWRLILVILIIAAAAGFAYWRIHTNLNNIANNPAPGGGGGRGGGGLGAGLVTPVQVATAQQKMMPIYLTALGSVTAYNTVTIKSRVDGQLTRVNFEEGQTVKQGDLLLQIDPRPYEAAVAQAKGQLAKDEANANNARAEAERYNTLYKDGVVSKESADAQLSISGQAAGSLEADHAAIQAAAVNLAYTSITSPINGVVGLRQVDPGNIVHAGDANGLLVITQIHPISVIFTIPEDQLPQVVKLYHGSKKLVVEAWDRSNSTKVATGSLLTIDNQIDQTTGTVKLKAVFQNQDSSLFPNQFVNVRLILQQRPDALVIPSQAISTGTNGATYVYLVHAGEAPPELRAQLAATGGGGSGRRGGNGGGGGGNAGGSGRQGGSGAGGSRRGGGADNSPYYVTEQPVKIDVTEGTDVIIADGLTAGQQVVIDGQEKLRPGSPVSIARVPGGNGSGNAGGSNAGTGSNTNPGPTSPGGVNDSSPNSPVRGGHAGEARGAGSRSQIEGNSDSGNGNNAGNGGRRQRNGSSNGGGGQGQPQ